MSSGEPNNDGVDGSDVNATNGSEHEANSPPVSAAGPAASDGAPTKSQPPKEVDDVVYSDIGINTLLNRLKQSIASARDFAAFLKKRSTLEEDQATGLKRLAKTHLDTIKRSESRGGGYATQLCEVMRVHERMADNGMQFALSLHQMHEDLNELSNNMERGRKQWKHDGLDAEKRASDAEAAMHKAKSRYDSLAEDYDRARTGDTKGSRRLGLKGPKSAEQHESDLLRKVQGADEDYEGKVRAAKSQRESLINTDRPKAVRALMELCRECDSGLTLQLQKFATFNEKLLLGNGLAVSPLPGEESKQKSLRDVIHEIDNDRDFHSYVGSHASKVTRPSEITYEKHPTLAPKTQQPSNRSVSGAAGPSSPPPQQPSLSATSGPMSQPNSTNSRYSTQAPPPGPLVAPSQPQQYGPPASQGSQSQQASGMYQSQGMQSPYQQQPLQSPTAMPDRSYQSPAFGDRPTRDNYQAAPPYPMHPSERSPPPSQQNMGSLSSPTQSTPYDGHPPNPRAAAASVSPGPNLPPLRPVFGVSLDDLFHRDQSAVPMLVIQCILAVDHFGLEIEGIYRLSGTSSLVSKLRAQFDNNPNGVDFRNPANFYHDVNSVATLLKQFFRDLPDPLFTRAEYPRFIEAARVEGEEQRRDALHGLINELPDPNYATLRALVLHLHRVMQHEGRNRMGASNLALCFAPSLMGTHTGAQIADASFQARVMDTILNNATAIFDED
ncbi:RhoGAP-domain-containing protein [Hortaea werneckii]|nr:RhoGAP-domain-containing protein [Hortaea werneckii]